MRVFMSGVVIIMLCLFWTFVIVENIKDSKYRAMEYAYMEGQKDAIEGDIRVKEVDGDWKFIKTPWDSGREYAHTYLSEYLD